MRLRQLILALIALSGIWVGVFIQRQHQAPPARAFSAGPTPPDFPAPKLIHVEGLDRPVSPTPIVHATPKVRVTPRRPSVPAPKQAKPRAQRAHRAHRARPTEAPPGELEPIEDDGRSYAETPPPPLEPLEISDAHVTALTSSSARVSWRTNVPTVAQTAFGLDAPTVWAQPSGDVLIEHQSVISGLEFSTTYTVYLHAVDEWNRAATSTVSLTTGPMPDLSAARTNGDKIVVDDRPFFPTAVWYQCSDMFGSNIADGINLFMGDGCVDDTTLPGRLGGRAYSIVDSENANATGRGVLGWYFPDEWDAYLDSNVTRAELEADIPQSRPGRISFLTLTNHFYSKAAPLPAGKGMYPVLFNIPDVLGFDLYPLQVWCKPAFGDVFDAQAELSQASRGKPTFQWIEVATMEHSCRNHRHLDPTPATVRAEAWLAVAGGADAIGYFPNHWSQSIGTEIAHTNREIKALTPALLAAPENARSDNGAVRVSARSLNGALYVIAVNTTDTTVQAKISVDGIAGRSATVFGGGSVVGADDQGFADTFGPLAARIYIIPPAGWS
jgi:hypothetical protein